MATLKDGRKIITTAGTREPLSASSVAIRSVTITAETDNAGIVVVGGVGTVVAAAGTRRGTPLAAGQTITLYKDEDGVDDLREVGLDATVSGDGVTYTYGSA